MTAPTKRTPALPQQQHRTSEASRRGMGLGTLITFFALAFGLSCGVITLVINRKAMLSGEGAVTEVLMPGEEDKGSTDDARNDARSVGIGPD